MRISTREIIGFRSGNNRGLVRVSTRKSHQLVLHDALEYLADIEAGRHLEQSPDIHLLLQENLV